MTPELVEAVAKIARHAWRGVHWQKTPEGPRLVREPLKVKHLEKHCAGGPGVGLAPITPGTSTTRIALLDFDSHKGEVPWEAMTTIARNVASMLEQGGLVPIPFRSSGGKGIHLIMLWDEEQDAYSVRCALRSALDACDLGPGTRGVKHRQVEIFPKQDSVPPDGYGSMFILPLTGESLPLDPATLELRGYEYAEDITEWPKSAPVPKLDKPTVQVYSSDAPASNSLAEIRSALEAIPNEGEASLDYDAWRNVVFAIHHASGGSDEGLALAHEFSSRSPKYDAQFLDERVWPYVRSERGGSVITERTLFDMARKHGWQENVLDDFEVLPNEPLEPAAPEQAVDTSAQMSTICPARFRVVPAGRFILRKPPEWIVRGVLPRAELALLIGPSGSGKSFLALDLAGAICRGARWRDKAIKEPGRVTYVAAEGAGGFRNRLAAYMSRHNLSADELQLGVISDTPNLMFKDDVKLVIQQLKAYGKVDVIFVDTFAQVTPGANENAAEDMGKALAHCKALHRATGALIVLVHHVGKDETRGARGWSGIKAAADAEITVTRNGAERVATISKMKDGVDGLDMPFRLEVVQLGQDEDGEPIDSCVVEHFELKANTAPRREPAGMNERTVWRAAHDLLEIGEPAARVTDVIELAVSRMPADPQKRDRRRETALRALTSLADSGFLVIENDLVKVAA